MRLIDVGVNTSEVEVRSQRGGAELVESDEDNVQISCPHVEVTPPTDAIEQIHVPHIDSSRDSHMSTYDIGTQETIPQLDGPIAVPSRLRRGRILECMRMESHPDSRTTTSHRREYPGDDSEDFHLNRRSDRDHRSPERRRS